MDKKESDLIIQKGEGQFIEDKKTKGLVEKQKKIIELISDNPRISKRKNRHKQYSN